MSSQPQQALNKFKVLNERFSGQKLERDSRVTISVYMYRDIIDHSTGVEDEIR